LCLIIYEESANNELGTDWKTGYLVMYFRFAGEDRHKALQQLLGGEEFECEKEITWTGKSGITIIAHPDAIYKKDGALIELKSTESTRCRKSPYPHHEDQTKYYMAITGAPYVKLFYTVLGYRLEKFFYEYLVVWSYPNEPKEVLHKIERDAAELKHGIDMKDRKTHHFTRSASITCAAFRPGAIDTPGPG